jgi:hypothetical protein
MVLSDRDFAAQRTQTRAEAVRRELTLRLKDVCQHLSAPDFDALILKMARVQLKGEGN